MKKILKQFFTLAIAMSLIISLATNVDTVFAEGQSEQYTPVETDSSTVDGSLYLKKTATKRSGTTEDIYDITLEAFVTGKVESTTSSVPTDIVLVLDVSGSMDDPISNKADYQKITDIETFSDLYTIYNNNKDIYYKTNNGEYKKINIYKYNYNGDLYVIYNEYNRQIESGYGDFELTRSYYIESESKLDALKSAVNSFIEETANANQSLSENQQHRISIVKFAGDERKKIGDEQYYSGRQDWGYYNYSQVVTDFLTVTDNNVNLLESYVENFEAGGATHADYGMKYANYVINGNSQMVYGLSGSRENANKVVIMFTDGEPTSENKFEEAVANSAIDNAKTLKENNVDIYTIGMFSNADPDQNPVSNPWTDKEKFNNYMHAVSSNYPDATKIDNLGSRAAESDYYKAASDSDSLNDIFESISQDISSAAISLNENAVLKDVISDYFEFNGTDKNDVKVYTDRIKNITTYNNQTTYEWFDQPSEISTLDVDVNNDTVTVSGFDYSANYVHVDENNEFVGKKLIVKFSVKPIDGFIGGNAVPTNKNISGVYADGNSGTEASCLFKVPLVDVPINYDFDVNIAKEYLTNTWSNISSIITDDSLSKISGLKNDYVDVVFTINQVDKNNNNTEEIIATYEIDAGKDEVTPGKNNSSISLDTDETRYLKVYVSIKPSLPHVLNEYDGYDINDNTTIDDQEFTKDKVSALYVLVPEVKSNDTQLFLGESVNLDDNVTVKEDWVLAESIDDKFINYNLIDPSDTKPDYHVEFTTTDSDIRGGEITNKVFTPTKEKVGYEFTYDIIVNDTPITDYAKKTHNATSDGCETDGSNCNENHFFVDVYSGSININKIIIGKTNKMQGDPIFTFHIKGTTEDNEIVNEYRTVRFTQDDTTSNKWIAEITGLKKGIYTITELDTIRYNCTNVTEATSVTHKADCDINNVDKSVTCYIGYSREDTTKMTNINKRNIKVNYTNTLVNDKDLNDTDIVTNSFKYENGNITISPDHYTVTNDE